MVDQMSWYLQELPVDLILCHWRKTRSLQLMFRSQPEECSPATKLRRDIICHVLPLCLLPCGPSLSSLSGLARCRARRHRRPGRPVFRLWRYALCHELKQAETAIEALLMLRREFVEGERKWK